MAIPRAFSFYMNELTNYTKNTLKLISENTSDLTSGSVLRLRLPTNTIINMRSLNFVFYVETSVSTKGKCRVQNAESLIKKCEWSCGGVNLSGANLQEYDLLYHILLLINGGSGFKKTRSILQNDDMIGMNSSLFTANETSRLMMIDDWFGFPNLQPFYIDTSILPQLEMQLTFNDPYCLAFSDNGGTSPSFTIKNYYFTIETIQFNSPIYDEIMSAKLNAGEIIEIPYQDCVQYDTTNTGSIRFNIPSHCISKILATNRAENYNTITQASVICRNGFTNRYRLDAGGSKTVVDATTANDCITVASLYASPSYGYRWSINGVSYPTYGNEHLAVGYSRLLDSFGDAASRYCQTSIPLESDKKSYPLYVPKIGWESATLGSFICTASATMAGVLITNSALIYVDGVSTSETTTTPSPIYLSPRELYTNYNFIIPLDLGLETDGSERLQTGYNSLGGNSIMTLELGSSGITNSGNIISIFGLTQPKLRIGASQMVEVIR